LIDAGCLIFTESAPEIISQTIKPFYHPSRPLAASKFGLPYVEEAEPHGDIRQPELAKVVKPEVAPARWQLRKGHIHFVALHRAQGRLLDYSATMTAVANFV
jgi:hypothetical protein